MASFDGSPDASSSSAAAPAWQAKLLAKYRARGAEERAAIKARDREATDAEFERLMADKAAADRSAHASFAKIPRFFAGGRRLQQKLRALAEAKGHAEFERKIQGTLSALNRHAFFNVCVVCTTIQAEIMLVKDLMGGDAAATAMFLSTTSSMAGMTEFILNPTVGRLSDTFGRRRFLLMGCSYAVVGNTLVGFFPQNKLLVGVNRFLNWSLLTVSGSVTGSAAVSDLSTPGKSLAKNLGSFFSSFGLGVILGPMVGGFVLARTGNPSRVYFARAAIAGLELVHDLLLLPETLGIRDRLRGLPMPPVPKFKGMVNPLSFVKLLRGTHAQPASQPANLASHRRGKMHAFLLLCATSAFATLTENSS